MLTSLWLQEVRDSGPIYRETVMDRFPVEPFNAASNFIFFATIIYFSLLIYKSDNKHWFLTACMPVYFIGFVGGTIYHATRSAELWLLMDWVPIVLLLLACSIYFVVRAKAALWSKLILMGIILFLNFAPMFVNLPRPYGNFVGYVGAAGAVVLPLLFYGRSSRWRHFKNVVYAIIAFIAAISFRTLDMLQDLEFLYMGTHWLWHTFGGVAVFFLMKYIYLDNEKSRSTIKSRQAKLV